MVLVEKSKVKSIFYIFLSIIYGYIFTLIPHFYFKDRVNYLSYAENYDFFLFLKSGASLLTGESLFLYMNKFLALFFVPENIVYSFVFFINFTLCFLFFSYSKKTILPLLGLLAFFLLPFGFSYQLGSLRQSIAISLFLFAIYYIKNVNVLLICISILLGLIHTSFLIVTPFLIADSVFLKFFSDRDLFYRLTLQLSLALFFGLLLSIISAIFSVDKLDDYLQYEAGSGWFFLFFIPFLVANIYRYYVNKKVDYITFLAIIGVMIYVVFYFLTPISGRVITIFFPFIFMSIINRLDFINICLLVYSILVGAWLFYHESYLAIMTI
ncbi:MULTISPECIES: EpsG family protein [Acinetobacter]|uniref:EpsG family protein n=1 Tax=Acinetobacter TaxID=469 RepID=UPI0015D2F2EA|nr:MULTISPECIES: EpsG family protein [Acinetobacter]MCP0912454.1 EpsG family protein [Acinetobacter pseudolwoffii]